MAANTCIDHKKRLSIAVIAWNLGQNALGRAYMLADILAPFYDVQIHGFVFSQKRPPIWEPLKNMNIPVFYYDGCEFPDFTELLKSIAPKITADVILVSKARIPSMQLGLMIKSLGNQPLLIDIDDYEIGFFENNNTLKDSDIKKPYGEIWTRFCESLISYSDEVFVSNIALQDKYGGVLIPHARDEKIFNPELYSKASRRKELGISLEDKIVLFLGTPREHKGLPQILKTIKDSGDRSCKLCVMGSFPQSELKNRLSAIGKEHLLMYPDQPFDDIAKNVVIADLVCLLQDHSSKVSQYQLPAKAIDAIAMGIPVLATSTPPLKPLIERGLVFPTDKDNLPDDLMRLLSDQGSLKNKQHNYRSVFHEEYSYKAVYSKIEKAISKSIKKTKDLPGDALAFMELQTRLFDDVNKLLQTVNERHMEAKKEEIEKQFQIIINSRTWRYTAMLRNWNTYFKRFYR